MPKFKLVALSTPVAGKEDEFHDWYQNVHLPQIVGLPGGQGAQRYQLVAKLMGGDPNQYLAIYDIECDDPMSFLGALGQASAEGKLTQTAANDMGSIYTALFSELGERVGA
ncbi:MAG: hypothetical protein ABIQ81_02980 [Novosphingobium sp.]